MQETKNLIDHHFNLWLERIHKPTEKQKSAYSVIESMQEEKNTLLYEYISEVQEQAFYGGFVMAMQLAADCYAEHKKIVFRQ
ncbi:MAG: hypothetical protein LIP12_00750 [Clostridiales bacterium]|nr:hypothetical protein [Clostridiales bacterium]